MTEHEEKKAEEMFQSFQKNYTQEDVDKINSKINGYNTINEAVESRVYVVLRRPVPSGAGVGGGATLYRYYS